MAKLLRKNVFGQYIFIKKFIFRLFGWLTRPRLIGFNNLSISNSKVLANLPDSGVVFVSNHQTIFADVVAMYHVMFAVRNGQIDSIKDSSYLKNTKENVYYIAAKETMAKGLLPPILAYAGSVSIERTWRQGDQMIRRNRNPNDVAEISKAIKDGWVVTFPQGTTRIGSHVRKGTAHVIKDYQPIVVPVRVDGFRDAFDKTGIKIVKKGINLSLKFKEPLKIDFQKDSVDDIVEKIAISIEEAYKKSPTD